MDDNQGPPLESETPTAVASPEVSTTATAGVGAGGSSAMAVGDTRAVPVSVAVASSSRNQTDDIQGMDELSSSVESTACDEWLQTAQSSIDSKSGIWSWAKKNGFDPTDTDNIGPLTLATVGSGQDVLERFSSHGELLESCTPDRRAVLERVTQCYDQTATEYAEMQKAYKKLLACVVRMSRVLDKEQAALQFTTPTPHTTGVGGTTHTTTNGTGASHSPVSGGEGGEVSGSGGGGGGGMWLVVVVTSRPRILVCIMRRVPV
eukprot:GFYU01003060.1.p1 GENE.GFYU01003060.1~~GFYU01003060.1.p1  ORF type:complete len:262 (+),score=52.75 GFYU01003060.1:28-813(+)